MRRHIIGQTRGMTKSHVCEGHGLMILGWTEVTGTGLASHACRCVAKRESLLPTLCSAWRGRNASAGHLEHENDKALKVML
jgi:hypothetical protein